MSVLKTISESYNFVFYELNDDRTRDAWPNISTIATILSFYLYFCLKIGPFWMKDRKPFDLKNVIFWYNVFQIFISTYLFYGGASVWIKDYSWTCQPVDYNTQSAAGNKVIYLVHLYTILKLIELLDTVFFVLRKKDRQISTLHLYHHFMMPICSWIGFKYYPNGQGTLLGVINCFVHMVMYTYYLIAGLGPRYQKYLWWKKYVTVLQLIQFFIVFVHNMIPLYIGCNYPKWINVLLGLSALQFVYMFGNFYYENYIKIKQPQNKNK